MISTEWNGLGQIRHLIWHTMCDNRANMLAVGRRWHGGRHVPAFMVNFFLLFILILKKIYFVFIWSVEIYESMMSSRLGSMGKSLDTMDESESTIPLRVTLGNAFNIKNIFVRSHISKYKKLFI